MSMDATLKALRLLEKRTGEAFHTVVAIATESGLSQTATLRWLEHAELRRYAVKVEAMQSATKWALNRSGDDYVDALLADEKEQGE